MANPAPLRTFFDELEKIVETVSPEDAPALIGDLERLKAMLYARLSAPQAPTVATCRPQKPDRYMSTKEAAAALGVKPRWLYEHADRIPGVQRLSRRCLRFSEKKLRRWISERRA